MSQTFVALMILVPFVGFCAYTLVHVIRVNLKK
jgi:hypothetical protein